MHRADAEKLVATMFVTTAGLRQTLLELEGEDVPLRHLAQWASSGLLVPSIDWARRRGAKRLYSFADVVRARTIVTMRQHGVSVQAVRVLLAWLDGHATKWERSTSRGTRTLVVQQGRVELHETVNGQDVITELPMRRGFEGQFRLRLEAVRVGVRDAMLKARHVA